jgi:CO/xanthine dehydrogenase FAD-binding subunit
MDLITVREIRSPRSRDELVFGPGDKPLGGGTWLYSEQQAGLDGLVDLTALGWPDIEEPGSRRTGSGETDAALTISATATIKTLADLRSREWTAAPLFWQAANSLLASFKIWNVATVGGNICISLPAGPMTSLAATLDATAIIWTVDGGERRMLVGDFVQGVRSNDLQHGEVLRAIEIPRHALDARTGFRRIALSPLGRTGTLVMARVDLGGHTVFTVTGGTTHPWVFRFDGLPSNAELQSELDRVDDWYDDPHGSPDWREAMSRRFCAELIEELA